MKICEDFAKEHGLTFSTNPNPKKSKTKCVAFLKTPRPLSPIKLNENNLPWINTPESVMHLGTTLENNFNGLATDIKQKRARYIQQNNEILQDFYFAYPETKCHLNNIYNNMSFYAIH